MQEKHDGDRVGQGSRDGASAARSRRFLRTLMRELAGTLQDVVGLEEASGFVSVVGSAIGTQIDGTTGPRCS